MDESTGVRRYRGGESSDAGTDRYQLCNLCRLYGRRFLGERVGHFCHRAAEPDHHAHDMQTLFLVNQTIPRQSVF